MHAVQYDSYGGGPAGLKVFYQLSLSLMGVYNILMLLFIELYIVLSDYWPKKCFDALIIFSVLNFWVC